MATAQAISISIPIRTDEHGIIRIANTRVTLDVVVARYQQGDTPEQILEGFPTLKLADIYAVITYYLNNQAEVDTYLREQDDAAEATLREIEAKRPDMFVLQARLREQLRNQDE